MKKISFYFHSLVLLLCIGVLTSCSETKEYESLISINENNMVVSINLEQLLTKSDIKNQITPEDQTEFINNITYGLEEDSKQLLKSVIDNPGNSGLNIKNRLYLAISYEGHEIESSQVSLFASVEDQSKLENLFKTLEKETEDVTQSEIDGFKSLAFNENEFHILYNKQIMIATTIKPESDEFKKLTQPEKTLNSYNYYKGIKSTDDLALAFSIKNLSQLNKQLTVNPASLAFTDSFYDKLDSRVFQVLSLNFEKGKIDLNQSIFAEEGADMTIFKEGEEILKKASGEFANHVGKDPLFFMNLGIDGTKLMTFVDKYFMTDEETRESIKDDFAQVKEYMNLVNGDITLALNSIDFNFISPSADFSVFCSTKGNTLYTKIVEWIKEKPSSSTAIVEETENLLTLSERGFTMYLGTENDRLFLTSNAELAKNPSKDVAPNIKESRYYTRSKDGYSYLSLDIQAILAIPIVQMGMSNLRGLQNADVKNFIMDLDYLDAKNNTPLASSTSLVFKSQEENSLKLLTKLLVQLTKM